MNLSAVVLLWRQIEIGALNTNLDKDFDNMQIPARAEDREGYLSATQDETSEEGRGRYFTSGRYRAMNRGAHFLQLLRLSIIIMTSNGTILLTFLMPS